MNTPLVTILLALINLLQGCAWVVEGRKHRENTRLLQTQVRSNDFDLATRYVEAYNERIVAPVMEQTKSLSKQVQQLESEVKQLQQTVNLLNHALQQINRCSVGDSCPVRHELQK
ncbi:MAG: hypothetical protein IJV22_02000 [Bacteroidales bacterium]|nr:hypothetical protein [Bacteroidales bacterium]